VIDIRINGRTFEADDASRNLLSFIRFDAGLTGTKYGCGEGLCGACTVLVDGQPLRACTSTVGAVAGGAITTIEGLAPEGSLHPVQQAFVDESAMQCGYCIPGFIMAGAKLLDEKAQPDLYDVQVALSGNICRCTGYRKILDAVLGTNP
jgi:aerobic-type carbon monoxide dehydrogenase small subunit (CoxS/CutS family)